MQLRKAARKAQSTGAVTRLVKLRNFNPVVPKGLEIVSLGTVHNMAGVTHVVMTLRPRV